MTTTSSPHQLRIVVKDLVVLRGERPVIAGLSFAVAAGEALILKGPNGAGKTTLLRALAGLTRPEAGTIALTGTWEPGGLARWHAHEDASNGEQCHFVGHLNAIKANLTVRENLQFWAKALNGDPKQAQDALAVTNLRAMADVPAGYLSAGQKRRLGLGRLLVALRPVWLLDEPTVSLDAASVTTFAGIVSEHLASGGIAVAATHVPLGIAGARELELRPLVLPEPSVAP